MADAGWHHRGFDEPEDEGYTPPEIKRCPACSKKKPLKDFPPSPTAPLGRFYYCKRCYNKWLKDASYVPDVCWIRGHPEGPLTERDAMLNFMGDFVTTQEYVRRCSSYYVRSHPQKRESKKEILARAERQKTSDRRSQRRVKALRMRKQRIPAELRSAADRADEERTRYLQTPTEYDKTCRECGRPRMYIRTSWISTDKRYKTCSLICSACGAKRPEVLRNLAKSQEPPPPPGSRSRKGPSRSKRRKSQGSSKSKSTSCR